MGIISKYLKITVITIVFILYFSIPSFSKDLFIHYLDVGHGNSQLIQLSDNKNILIDSGNIESSYKVIKYLRERNIKNIDLVIISNPSIENFGGLLKISKIFYISEVFDSGVSTYSQNYLKLLNQFSANNTKVTIVKKGKIKKYSDNIKLEILSPQNSLINNSISDIRNNSIVIKLTHNKNSFLFAGDIQSETQNFLVENIKKDLSSNVIKLPNSINKNEINNNFLNNVNPQMAIISSGVNNIYNFPNLELLNTLKNKNIAIYRTDINGDITIISDGKHISLNMKKNTSVKIQNKNSRKNINDAKIEELELLPYINETNLKKLLDIRPINSLDSLGKIGLSIDKINEIKKFAIADILKNKKININTASFEEIKNIPKISDALAKKIIKNRPYLNISDLLKIDGIDKKRLKNLIEFVAVN